MINNTGNVIVLISIFTASIANAAPIVTNGSLTGPIANSGVPSGWSVTSGSPDTMTETSNVGIPNRFNFFATPSGPSPDGGTWVSLADTTIPFESFGQSISGFSIGAEYELSWYQGNFGITSSSGPGGPGERSSANAFEFLANSASIGVGSLLGTGSDWFNDSITFFATDETLFIDIKLANQVGSYMAIDGITLNELNAVPIPAAIWLFSSGLIGLIGLSRYKRT